MSTQNNFNRRSFLKTSSLAGGGLLISFSSFAGLIGAAEMAGAAGDKTLELNSFIKISENGQIMLVSSNPEFGSNVKTSMPMILAEELDVDWKDVIVEQADFAPKKFERQFTGGSQAIRTAWKPLRTAGATARQMLISAAALSWNVPVEEIATEKGVLFHKSSGKKAGYGEMAAKAATLPVPKNVPLKKLSEFTIIGSSKKNVDGDRKSVV